MALGNWLSFGDRGGRSRFQNPYYRLQPHEISLAAQAGVAIDVNRAGVDDWLRLPGISIHQARSLVSLVQSGVQFHCLEDLAAALSVPVQRIAGLAPVLQFNYYDPASAAIAQPMNPNMASVEELTRIPGVDIYLARAIVQNRTSYGRFQNIAHLQQRLGLSAAMTAQVMHYFRF
ncbi:helix-hairpin-helix domain-containing protein [Leptolyngbya sp. AN02str]|uniref:helix-hairpin-helix domain-containing protein n=1 Tax=Leptolyngbya sp. AN02str TaxID=3423363 RepID=UPI003D3197B1